MIYTYTWQVSVPDGKDASDVADQVVTVGAGISKLTKILLDTHAQPSADGVLVSLRISGEDRWKVQSNARKIADKLFKASQLYSADKTLVSVDKPVSGQALTYEQGRTRRVPPPRSTPLA